MSIAVLGPADDGANETNRTPRPNQTHPPRPTNPAHPTPPTAPACQPPTGPLPAAAPAAFRTVRILEELSRAGAPMRLTELALALAYPKSSVHNLLATLESVGMVRQLPGGWVIGYKAIDFGRAALGGAPERFREQIDANPVLAAETALQAALDGTDIVCTGRHDGPRRVRVAIAIGDRMPAVVTALGKAMLAVLPQHALDDFLGSLAELPRLTRQGHPSVDALRRDLDVIRQRGYAIDCEQNAVGITCFAVAVPGADEPTAIAVTLPTQDVDDVAQRTLTTELIGLARNQSQEIRR